MALAPSPRLEPPQTEWTEQAFAPAGVLVSAVVEASAADVGWLAWLDRSDPVVICREALSPVEPSLIAEFPDPPDEPIIIDTGAPFGPWALWCRARGIQSCVVVPVLARARAIGTAGLVSSTARALRERHAVVLNFSQLDPAIAAERRALFTSTTQVGAILPFFAGPRTQGVLIVGEERRSRCQPMSPERIAILELVASRIAHVLRISRLLEYERQAERRRQRQLTIERQRLAREVDDGVGQALSTLLVQVRCAMAEGTAGLHDLQDLERAAGRAVDGARALAYGIRHLERGIGALEEARSYAETMLRSVHCRLSWTEERNDLKIASRVLREIAHVIKESITNVVRLANATSVRVRVEYPDGRIRVTIYDDGAGSSLHEARPSGDGLGLVEGSERLARVGGTVDVRSALARVGIILVLASR